MTRATSSGANTKYWYVDIAASRIQTWLSRSARLRFRRGASYELARLTSSLEINALLSAQAGDVSLGSVVEWNPEAGEISGVVPLRFPVGTLDDSAARAVAIAAETLIAQSVRRRLPACPLLARFGAGESYVDWRRADSSEHTLLFEWMGELDSGFVARPCLLCGNSRASQRSSVPPNDEVLDLCRDCLSRVEAFPEEDETANKGSVAGYSKSTNPDLLPKAQAELYDLLNKAVGATGGHFPSDFRQLASRGSDEAADAGTQLAFLYADGNRLGDLIALWLEGTSNSLDDASQVPKATLVAAISTATKPRSTDELVLSARRL